MSDKPIYEVGIVYDNIPPAHEFFPNIDQYARDYFRLRNITYSERVDRIKDAADNTVNGLIANHLREYAKQGLKFLDIGSANGRKILDIEKRLGTILGKYVFDIDPGSISEAIKCGISSIQGSITDRLPYDNETFDAVSLLWVLSCIAPDKRKNLIAEINRVLKPGGRLYLEDVKYGVFEGDKKYFEQVLKPSGYREGMFFVGIFEPTGLRSEIPENVSNPILGVSDRNPAYKLISLPMCASLLRLDEVEQLRGNYFDFENIYFIEGLDAQRAETVVATDKNCIETQYQNTWGIFLEILKRK